MSKNTLIAVAVIIVLGLAGWYLLRSQKPYTPQTPTQVTQTPIPDSASSATEEADMTKEKNVVKITSSGFSPQNITIAAGQTVTWINDDSESHQVNSAVHPTHQVYLPLNTVGLLQSGEKKSLSFPETGTYKYHDHLNPSLTGSVTVE